MATYSGHFRDSMSRIETFSYPIHSIFPPQVRFTECFFSGKKGLARKFRIPSGRDLPRLDSRKIRSVGVMRYWAAYTSSTRAIPYRAAIPREKFRAPETRPLHKH